MGLLSLLRNMFTDGLRDWIKTASEDDLRNRYDELRTTIYKKTGIKNSEMNRISGELYRRYREKEIYIPQKVQAIDGQM